MDLPAMLEHMYQRIGSIHQLCRICPVHMPKSSGALPATLADSFSAKAWDIETSAQSRWHAPEKQSGEEFQAARRLTAVDTMGVGRALQWHSCASKSGTQMGLG